MTHIMALLRNVGLLPTPQRLAVARFVLATTSHPTADQVLEQARRDCPTLSRATVYNTLRSFSEKGLVKLQTIREGVVVFDANVRRHHHFVDEDTGKVHDVPWESLRVSGQERLTGLDISDYQVVMRGKKRSG